MKNLLTNQKNGLNSSRQLTSLFVSLMAVASFTASATDVSIYGGQVNGLSVEHEIVNDWGVFIGVQYNAHSELTGKINGYTFDVPLQTFGLVLEKRFKFEQSDFSVGVNGGAQFLLEDITILEHQDTSPRDLLSKHDVIPTLGINAKYQFSEKLNLLAGTQYLFETSPLDQQLSFYVGVSYTFGSTPTSLMMKKSAVDSGHLSTSTPKRDVIAETPVKVKAEAFEASDSLTVEHNDEVTPPINVAENNELDITSLYCLQAGAFKSSRYLDGRLAIVKEVADNITVKESNGFSIVFLVFNENEARSNTKILLQQQGINSINFTCSKISAIN